MGVDLYNILLSWTQEDWRHFIEAMNNPRPPNQKFIDAVKHYHETQTP